MTFLSLSRQTNKFYLSPLLQAVGWIVCAAALGLIAATQPLPITALIIGAAALVLSSLITPFAPLTIMLIIAPIRTLFATESGIALPLDFGQLLLAAALGFWLINRIAFAGTLPRLRTSPVLIGVLIFTAAGGLTAFSAISLGAWLTEWLKWIQIGLLILFCLDAAAHRQWEWLVFALIAAGLTNALIGMYQFFGGSGAVHLLISPASRYFRAFGTFGQPNPFGGFMGLIAPIATAAALGYGWQTWLNWRVAHWVSPSRLLIAGFYAAAAALIAIALIMSWSRGAWLAFGISMLVIVVAAPRKLWHGLGLLATVGLVGGLLYASGRLPASITDRIASATQETFSFTDVRGVDVSPENYPLVERLAHWQAALNMAQDRPYLGVGLGNYEVAYPGYRLLYWEMALGHAHNYYLNVFGETGMIGLVCYGAMWVLVIFTTWHVTRRHPDPLGRMIAVGLLGSWMYLTFHSLTDNLYVNNLFLQLGVMLGILAVLHRQLAYKSNIMRVAWGSPKHLSTEKS